MPASEGVEEALGNQAEVFAQQISDTVNAVLTGTHELALDQVENRYVLQPGSKAEEHRPSIPLYLSGAEDLIGRLHFRYDMTLDHQDKYLKVVFSSCSIIASSDGSALLRLDYQPNNMKGRRAPVAHWQLSAHQNAFANWLTLAQVAHKRAGNSKGRLDKIHLTTGGERFRPCLEDVLQLLVTDLGVSKRSGSMKAIEAGRARWREMQLRAAVRDNPRIAATVLAECGYIVTPGVPKPPRPEKHTHY